MEDRMSYGEAAQLALHVQDACNLSGVVHTWSRVMERYFSGMATDLRNRHPVNVLFASKVASLTNCEVPSEFSRAYEACKLASETK